MYTQRFFPFVKVFLLLVFGVTASNHCWSQSLFPDLAFGTGGKVTLAKGGCDEICALADGGILALGGVMQSNGFRTTAMCFKDNGAIDTSFGKNGKFYDSAMNDFTRVVQQPDGKIIIAGTEDSTITMGGMKLNIAHFYVLRLKRDGSNDSSFGQNGKIRYHASYYQTGDDDFSSILLLPNGKIIVIGSTTILNGYDAITLVRFMPDGQVDSSFGNNGKVQTYFGQYSVTTYDVGLLPDGRIVVAAWGSLDNVGYCWTALRYQTNGTLDSTYGTNGFAALNYGPFTHCWAMAVQSGGKVVLAGRDYDDSLVVAQLDTTGHSDLSFGQGAGAVSIAPIDLNISILVRDNQILVGGTNISDSSWTLYLLDDAGNLIGNKPALHEKFMAFQNELYSLALLPNGKVLAAGSCNAYASQPGFFTLGRYEWAPLGTGTAPGLPAEDDCSVFPNPASTSITIRTGHQVHMVQLLAPTGALVQQAPLSASGNWPLLKGLASGSYVLRILCTDGFSFSRILYLQTP